ncbi:hypothetical protein HBH89_132580 [Parastagonospora nodorum]|nr:hypothetical protein HBI02_183870 [Parastagonospora nodorum]KAH4324309.1 hypothetical protein HBI00_172340 [Parastagonospora nodorum]KAH4497987.1 hypothetical protein HBH89_132580 [Parastagonospora nodorum]KAH4503018.1 hypothetical protein HBH87_173040 [Parastagonospora nodorum]KAH4592662.1 hypothetical protein HBH83_064380 [Parastagonospora nodorum]
MISITITRAPRRPIIILLHHIPTSLHSKLALLQYAPELRIPGVRQLHGLQLRLVPYPGIAASVEQYLYNGVAVACPVGLVERVYIADGFVQGRVLFHAVDFVDFEAFLVEEDVDDFVWGLLVFSVLEIVLVKPTASICCCHVKSAVAYTVPCTVEQLCYEFSGLAAGLLCGGRDVF